jgi:hypothetical protein
MFDSLLCEVAKILLRKLGRLTFSASLLLPDRFRTFAGLKNLEANGFRSTNR